MKYIQTSFSTPMVQALLEGRKTQRRWVVKPQPDKMPFQITPDFVNFKPNWGKWSWGKKDSGQVYLKHCPYGQPGDVLWVRETAICVGFNGNEEYDFPGKWFFRADNPDLDLIQYEEARWKPMPKVACRIWLEVKGVRVERLHDITEEDAIAEGIETQLVGMNCSKEDLPEPYLMGKKYDYPKGYKGHHSWMLPKPSYRSLWISINGPKSWEANSWVWVVDFERCDKPDGF